MTWTEPLQLNSEHVRAQGFEPDLATDGQGNWVVIWKGTDYYLQSAHSSDNGVSWSVESPIIREIVHEPRITYDGIGK